MKKTILMFIMLLGITMLSFGQTTFSSYELRTKYGLYYNSLGFDKPLSYNDWIIKNGFQLDAKTTEKMRIISESKIYRPTPGSYLIKAKKQIIGGFLCQLISTGVIVFNSGTLDLSKYTLAEQNKRANTQKTINIGAGVLSIIGLGFEISGVCNLGKAGLSLDENGIGVKVKF
jgi:hypothetical protein